MRYGTALTNLSGNILLNPMFTGVCPSCGLIADLEVFLMDEDDKAALVAALSLPQSLARPLTRYLKLFSPPKRALTGKKKRRLLEELAQTVPAGEVTRHGIVHPAPLTYWEEALEKILASPPAELPLQNHHYLYQVVWAMGEQAAAKTERAVEEQRRQPRTESRARGGPAPIGAAIGQILARAVQEAPDKETAKRGVAQLREALKPALPAAPADDHITVSDPP